MAEEATFRIDGKDETFPLLEGSEGERAIDISSLRSRTGHITLDSGFGNTGACQSAITFIDGEKGILRYRGIPIEELAEKGSFLETAYLLIFGRLPNKSELDGFVGEVRSHTMVHESVKQFYVGFPRRAHPMAVCSAVVSALSAFYPERIAQGDEVAETSVIVRLLAKLPTIAAHSFKHSVGQPMVYPDNSLDYSANFLRMMFAVPCEKYDVDPVIARALDMLLILHADHEQNCSTSTVRLVGSSLSNLFASISAGISALWGPRHGGANEAVIRMLGDIADGDGSAKNFVRRAKSGDGRARLMGFGHRVYKNYDPRAKILKVACHDVLEKIGVSSPLLDIAAELEEIATHDEYFLERKLYPNVDFYSGIIYQALGIPMNMFTVLFAMGRLPGWIAHWVEMRKDSGLRIGRPRQVYTGPTLNHYVPIEQR